jgi:hypothetical protein
VVGEVVVHRVDVDAPGVVVELDPVGEEPAHECQSLSAGHESHMPEAEVHVSEVKAIRTKSGNTRFVLIDDAGNEYSTFKENVASSLPGLKGRRARIKFHEQERNGFTNVYLDSAEPVEGGGGDASDRDADEVAWKTAMEAAPYLLSSDAVEEEVPPEELFEKLQPFKELVAEDIEGDDED